MRDENQVVTHSEVVFLQARALGEYNHPRVGNF